MHSTKKISKTKLFLYLTLIVLAIFGYFYMYYTWIAATQETTKEAIDIATTAEASLNGEVFEKLRAVPEDVGTLEYESIKKRMIHIIEINKEIRFAYIYIKRDDKIYFAVDSEPVDSKDYSPPGQEFEEFSEEDVRPFEDGKVVLTKPATDRWGTWVSVLVPMKDDQTGKTVAVFGMDYPAETWNNAAVAHTAQAGVVVFIVLLLFFAFYIILNKNENLKRWQEIISEDKANLELIFNTSPDMVMITRLADGYIEDINEGFTTLTGFDREDVIGKSTIEIAIWENPEERQKIVDELEKKGTFENLEFVFKKKDGSEFIGLMSAKSILLQGIPHLISVTHDITERRRVGNLLSASEEKYRLLAEFASDVIWVLNLEKDRFTYVSPAVFHLRGLTQEEAMNESLEDAMTPESAIMVRDAIAKNVKEFVKNPNVPNYYINEVQQPCKNGKTIWFEMSTKFRYNIDGDIEVVGVSRYIDSRKKAEEEILYLSHNDPLTGLANRRFYEQELERLDDEKYIPLTLVMADVNGLKLTNDAFGHKTGDILLEKVANILKKECRTGDIVARIGGDEFVLLLPETDSKNADKIINRINKAIANEKLNNIVLSVSIGFAVKQDISEDVNEIFKKAEDEMYKRKLSESSSMRRNTIEQIMKTLYEKGNRDMVHSKRVSEVCEAIASKMDLDREAVEEVRLAGLMHDIGKIGIDEKILNKPKKLNSDEEDEVERHSEIGYRILSSVNEFSKIAEYVLEHHERWNGEGYPRGLVGEEISLQARIVAVADSYDALTSDRSYRKALSEEDAIKEIKKRAGVQFDPIIARVFIEEVLGEKWE